MGCNACSILRRMLSCTGVADVEGPSPAASAFAPLGRSSDAAVAGCAPLGAPVAAAGVEAPF